MADFSDDDFNGRIVTKDYFVPYFKDDHKNHYTYHVELLKLSEGCWRNMEAEFNYSWSNLAYFGQSAIYPYTNIIGGLGAFATVPLRLFFYDRSLTVSNFAVKEHYKLSGIQKTAAGAIPTAVFLWIQI